MTDARTRPGGAVGGEPALKSRANGAQHERLSTEERRRRLADRIRHARDREGLSQEQLAIALGVTPAYISQLEQGKKLPSSDLCPALVKALPRLGLPCARLILEVYMLRSSDEVARILDTELVASSEDYALPKPFIRLLDRWRASQLPDDRLEEFAELCLANLDVLTKRGPSVDGPKAGRKSRGS